MHGITVCKISHSKFLRRHNFFWRYGPRFWIILKFNLKEKSVEL
jgi:hypothetical protein